MSKKPIGKVYDSRTNDFFGTVVGISGGLLTVEVPREEGWDDVLTVGLEELKQRYGVRVEWTKEPVFYG